MHNDAPEAYEPIVLNTQGEVKPKKSKKWLFVVLGIVLAAAIVIGVLFALGVFDGNSAEDDSEDILYVEEEPVPVFDNAYDQFEYLERRSVMGLLGSSDSATPDFNSLEAHILLGDLIISSMEESGQTTSLKWIKDILITCGYASEGQDACVNMGIGLGDQKIGTARVIVEPEQGLIYVGLPELSDTYVSFDLEALAEAFSGMKDIDLGEYASAMDSFGGMGTAGIVSVEQLEGIISRYLDVVLSSFDEVVSAQETITVSGVSQQVTALTVNISEKQFVEMLIAVLNELKNDQELFGIIQGYIDNIEQMAAQFDTEASFNVDVFSEFSGYTDTYITELEELLATAATDPSVTWIDYVDDSGSIVGRSLTASSGEKIYYMTATANGKFAFEADIAGFAQITGSGTDENGKTSGAYEVTLDGTPVLMIETHDMIYSSSVGLVNGTIIVIPTQALVNELMSEISGVGYPANLAFEYSTRVGKKSSDYSIKILLDNALLIGFTAEAKQKKIDFDIPKQSVDILGDTDGLKNWIRGLSFDKILDNMEKAGVPNMYVKQIRSLTDLLPLYLAG